MPFQRENCAVEGFHETVAQPALEPPAKAGRISALKMDKRTAYAVNKGGTAEKVWSLVEYTRGFLLFYRIKMSNRK